MTYGMVYSAADKRNKKPAGAVGGCWGLLGDAVTFAGLPSMELGWWKEAVIAAVATVVRVGVVLEPTVKGELAMWERRPGSCSHLRMFSHLRLLPPPGWGETPGDRPSSPMATVDHFTFNFPVKFLGTPQPALILLLKCKRHSPSCLKLFPGKDPCPQGSTLPFRGPCVTVPVTDPPCHSLSPPHVTATQCHCPPTSFSFPCHPPPIHVHLGHMQPIRVKGQGLPSSASLSSALGCIRPSTH